MLGQCSSISKLRKQQYYLLNESCDINDRLPPESAPTAPSLASKMSLLALLSRQAVPSGLLRACQAAEQQGSSVLGLLDAGDGPSTSYPSHQWDQVRTATKKAGGTARQNPDTKSRNLGVKFLHNEIVFPGQIIVRQRGTKWHPGYNVGLGVVSAREVACSAPAGRCACAVL